MLIMNPGSGPVPGATEDNALNNIGAFVADLAQAGAVVTDTIRRRADDPGDGRYAFEVLFDNDYRADVDMPGLPLDKVRAGQDASLWDVPRLFVDGSSWWWGNAINLIAGKYHDEGDDHE